MARLLPVIRPLAASLAIACVLAGPAAAQDDGGQALPDPNQPVAAQSGVSNSLPNTGVPTLALLTAGLSLLAGGVAVLPAPRRRRTYRSVEWHGAVAVRARD